MFKPTQPAWLNALTYILGYLICIGLILTSYLENNFYNNYIKGDSYLVWTVYIFPWIILIMLTIHALDEYGFINTKEIYWSIIRKITKNK